MHGCLLKHVSSIGGDLPVMQMKGIYNSTRIFIEHWLQMGVRNSLSICVSIFDDVTLSGRSNISNSEFQIFNHAVSY